MRPLVCAFAIILGVSTLGASAQNANSGAGAAENCTILDAQTRFCEVESQWLVFGEVSESAQSVRIYLVSDSNRYEGAFGVLPEGASDFVQLEEVTTRLLGQMDAGSSEGQEGVVVTATSDTMFGSFPTQNIELSFDNQGFRTKSVITVAIASTQTYVLQTWETKEGTQEQMNEMHQAALSSIQINEP